MDPCETADDESTHESTIGTLERPNTPPHPEAGRVKTVYREVWDEFFREARKHSGAHIDALCRRPSRADHDTLLEDEILAQWHAAAEVERAHASDEFQDVIMEEEDPREKYATIRTERYPAVQEHPVYEACAPTVRNMSFREGDPASDRDPKLHFVPYADLDNPKFDYVTYAENFDYFAWEWGVDDNPDVETIQGETVRRLHFGHKLDLDTIGATKALPPLRNTNEDGLLWYHAQRDPVPWFKNPAHDYPTLPTTTYKASGPKESFANNASVFCSNLNCVMAICPTHPKPKPLREPPKATKTADGIRCLVVEPCGGNCISVVTDRDRESVPPRDWTAVEIEELETVLMLEPDALPCHLAVLCRKTCWEVFEQRCLLLPDAKIAAVTHPPEPRANRIQFWDTKREDVIDSLPPEPCEHRGPCSSEGADCACLLAGYHCTRECRCDDTCRGGDKNGTFCKNMDIQLGRAVVGTFGLGAFAMEDIRTNTYIGEYVGELGLQCFDSRDAIREYVGLNYMFRVNEVNDEDGEEITELGLNSDSARVGNETRYINHPVSKGGANVCALQCLVNGEFRMGIWSTTGIPKGEELFLDYGEGYFPDPKTGQIGKPAKPKKGRRRRQRK